MGKQHTGESYKTVQRSGEACPELMRRGLAGVGHVKQGRGKGEILTPHLELSV